MTTGYTVTALCCTSGNCLRCNGRTPYGKPIRQIVRSAETREQADKVARNWRGYDSNVEEAA